MNFFCLILMTILFFVSGQLRAESLESIMNVHDSRIEQAKKSYDANVEKTTEQTVKRLEQLKKTITRTGKLEDALAIQNQINKLKGLPPLTAEEEKVDGLGGVPESPDAEAPLSAKKAEKKLETRYVEFHEALIDKNYDKAIEYLDPSTVKSVDRKVIEGYLQLMAGALHIFQVKKNGIGVERFKFTEKLKEARITGKVRSSLNGKWKENDKPSYWIYKQGEWYLGDEKELRKLF